MIPELDAQAERLTPKASVTDDPATQRPMTIQRPVVNVTLLPPGITVAASVGDTLLDAALDNNIDLPHECGGNCTCTTCHVHVISGGDNLSRMEEPERFRIQFAGARSRESRLACQALLTGGPVTVRIPDGITFQSIDRDILLT